MNINTTKACSLTAACITFCSLVGGANAAVVTFDFDFLDSNSISVGTGFISFDDNLSGNSVSFSNLQLFSWSFEIPSLGLVASSSSGGFLRDPQTDEGIELQGVEPNRTLSFFDNVGTTLVFSESGVGGSSDFFRFSSSNFGNTFAADTGGSTLVGGTFVATEAIPEPSSFSLLSLLLCVSCFFRRRKI